MANDTNSNLMFVDGVWKSCGCGGKPKVTVTPPPNSKAVLVKSAEKLVGPVTGIEYSFLPHQVSIDVDAADADEWLKTKKATIATSGYRGRLSRTGKVHAKKE